MPEYRRILLDGSCVLIRLANHIVAGPTAVPAGSGAQPSASEEVICTAFGGDWEIRGIRSPVRA